MRFHTRKMIKYEDLNHAGLLFGGRLLSWIDEEAWVFACCQLDTTSIVTKFISEIEFISSAKLGEAIEIGFTAIRLGRTSITLGCKVRNKMSKQDILAVETIVMVCVDEAGKPKPHHKLELTQLDDDFYSSSSSQ